MSAGKNTFFILERNSGSRYLVDTCAQVSVIPATESDRRGHRGDGLKAANQTPIGTYGKRVIMLRFGEKRFEHEFVIADVPNKICLLYTSPSPRDKRQSRMPSSA